MIKNLFLNTASYLMDANNDGGSEADEKAKLRAALAKTVSVGKKSDNETEAKTNETEEETEEEEEEETEEEKEEEKEEEEKKEEETEEAKAAREKQEKEAAKLKRKDDRIQRRIDTAIAEKKAAEAEVARLKAQIEANPEKKLTEEEVESRAEAKAAKRIADAEIERLQKEFDANCDKLQAEGNKLDKEFTTKVVSMAELFGPIPSRVIGILSDLENGAEVLKFMVDDDDEAEKIYNLKDKPERLAIALVRIADKLAEEKKPKPKQISKVPNPIKPVKSGGVQSTQITEADTKNIDSYIRKRIAQKEALKKQRGY
jgi:hypothetical protein